MIQEIKSKYNDISKRKPDYLGDYEYGMIKVEYHSTLTTLLKLLSNFILNDRQIERNGNE
jgi:hypothetical protein